MPRWFWFAPLAILVLVFGYNGLKLGMIRANVTETAVIDHFAAQYLDDHARMIGPGAALTDCVAVPGYDPGVWLELRCTPPEGAAFLYGVRRDGALIYAARDATQDRT